MIIRTTQEEKGIRTAGLILAEVLTEVGRAVRPGSTTASLDLLAEELLRARGAKPAFLNYKPDGAAYPYPAVLCVSINDEVVHGIPSEERILKEGDTVMLDLGLSYDGFFADAAITVPVGEVDPDARRLLRATREALAAAVTAAKAGARIGNIGSAIEAVARTYGYAVVDELGGHALGRRPHEKPFIPNVGEPGTGAILEEGLVLALEPIFTNGKKAIVLDSDQWTYRTRDGSRSAEFEQTIIVGKNGGDVVTPWVVE